MATSPRTPFTWMHQVDRNAHQMPDRPALRYAGQGTTWRALRDRSNQIAHTLASLGIGAGDRVAVLLSNRKEYVELVVGINRLGAIAVPVNFRLRAAEVTYILEDSGATVLVSESAFDLADTGAKAIAATGRDIAHLVLDATDGQQDFEAMIGGSPVDPVEWPESVDSCALIMYTSGTTGSPKGAMLSYANITSHAATFVPGFELHGDDEVILVTSPIFHIAAMGATLPALLYGFTVAIAPTGAFDAEGFLDLAESERATMCFLVPTQWRDVCSSPTIGNRVLALRTLAWGAAPATPSLLRAMNEAFPGRKIISTFGQTEMSPNTTMLRGEDAVRKLGSVGKPLPNVQVRVVDPLMNDVPRGEVGEIVYRGPNVMLGYWNKPSETAAAFAGGWFHSGDLVTEDEDGFYFVVDRLKDMIISGGENIYCAEVEAVIAEHPSVREAALVGRPHERWGETPIAFVTALDSENPPTPEDVIDFVKDRIAGYKKPSTVVVLPDMPRNASGKILKAPLRERARAEPSSSS